jgi:arylsulfatase A-like enzyme
MVNGKPRYLTTVMTEKAVAFLKETKTKPEQPFCLVVALKEPHGPLDYFDPEYKDPYTNATIPPPKNLSRSSFEALPEKVKSSLGAMPQWFEKPETYQAALRKTYAYTSRADAAVGEICRALKEQGLDQNTVVIHMSDNGSMDGAHGLDGKWLMYEESIHVPLIIRDPRLPKSTQGRRSQMALSIDLAPTILAMAGVPIPKSMQGRDLQPLLRNAKAKGRDDWYYEHTYNTDPPRKPIPKSEGVRTERWKYIRYTEETPPLEQLFDLQTDPQEERDLASAPTHSKTLSTLRARCDSYRKTLR